MEERIKKLEMVTNRLMRRANKTKSALITPYPISHAVSGDNITGTILKYMFPCDGEIVKGFVRVKTKPKNGSFIYLWISGKEQSMQGYSIDKVLVTINPSIKVIAGDCLEVSLDPKEENITEIWVSLLWKPSISDVDVKSFLIEELEKDIE